MKDALVALMVTWVLTWLEYLVKVWLTVELALVILSWHGVL